MTRREARLRKGVYVRSERWCRGRGSDLCLCNVRVCARDRGLLLSTNFVPQAAVAVAVGSWIPLAPLVTPSTLAPAAAGSRVIASAGSSRAAADSAGGEGAASPPIVLVHGPFG